MNYKEAIEYINELGQLGSRPGLERVKELAGRLGNPQDKLRIIHITGTNGKGSTAMFIAGILICAGFKTGLYTSPHIEGINEEIRINCKEIPDEDFAEYVMKVKAQADKMVEDGFDHPTRFEVLTALSFLYFYEKKCDIAVIEVGMGGRADATNIVLNPVVSVITKIAPDHTPLLGNSPEDIAYEKAGIIKKNGNVVLYPQEEKVLKVIKEVSDSKNARIYYADINQISDIQLRRGQLGFNHPAYGRLQTPVVGIHQAYNAAVAIKTVEVLNKAGNTITKDAVKEGFFSAEWPGRFELLHTDPDFYIDGGHNPDAIRSLIETFRRVYPGKKANIIMGVMKDKEYETMVREISSIAKSFTAITPDNPRALPAENLAKVMHRYCNDVKFNDTIREAVRKLLTSVSNDEIIIATGSLYYIGQIRKMFKQ
ncbi:MAG: bifunctional folylpolyglutamate synthase/dihydrofolate synthase [Clostridiaceae bacterium]|nr:bifunctional folylpolyglutamate synthase/dihydrofolate synthase [Clostridiaceae bacterium]